MRKRAFLTITDRDELVTVRLLSAFIQAALPNRRNAAVPSP
jgi:hypothetical protein